MGTNSPSAETAPKGKKGEKKSNSIQHFLDSRVVPGALEWLARRHSPSACTVLGQVKTTMT